MTPTVDWYGYDIRLHMRMYYSIISIHVDSIFIDANRKVSVLKAGVFFHTPHNYSMVTTDLALAILFFIMRGVQMCA